MRTMAFSYAAVVKNKSHCKRVSTTNRPKSWYEQMEETENEFMVSLVYHFVFDI